MVLPGDGVGPEIIREGLKVIRAALDLVSLDVQFTELEIGAARYRRTGTAFGHAGRKKRGGAEFGSLREHHCRPCRGGLAHTNVVANMFMAGISGAALADCAAIGSILIPAMREAGYDKKFSVVITVSASLLGPIIPPSVAMIIYAYAVGGTVTVGGLFMSGVIPGVISRFRNDGPSAISLRFAAITLSMKRLSASRSF